MLVKYKYVLLAKRTGRETNEINEYGSKILDNLNQFGLISKNPYFVAYLKEALSFEKVNNENNVIITKDNHKEPVPLNVNK